MDSENNNIKIYRCERGIVYANLKAFEAISKEKGLGKFIAETSHNLHPDSPGSFSDDYGTDFGVEICQSEIDENIGYRVDINRGQLDYIYPNKGMVERLQAIQPSVKLTQFPYGYVIRKGQIDGEIIPYYPNAKSLTEYSQNITDKEFINLYKQVLEILKEMYENGVMYLDLHGKNFLINLDEQQKPIIHTIDFENKYLHFAEYNDYCKNNMINALKLFLIAMKKMLKDISYESELSELTDDFITKVIK